MIQPLTNYILVIAYDGTRYYGWQKTGSGPSIEEELERGLQLLLKHPVNLQAASRTDRGVHAQRQVVNFFTPKAIELTKFKRSLNGILPEDISVLSVKEVEEAFHPTLDARCKEYRYALDLGPTPSPFKRKVAWHIPLPIHMDAMKQAALPLIGEHDFKSFTNNCHKAGESTRCTLFRIDLHPMEKGLLISLEGDRFLYKMARNITGTLVDAGLGKIEPRTIPEILHQRDRRRAGVTAPAHGLTLHHVEYDLNIP